MTRAFYDFYSILLRDTVATETMKPEAYQIISPQESNVATQRVACELAKQHVSLSMRLGMVS